MQRIPWPLKLCVSTTVALLTAVVGLLVIELGWRVQDQRAGRTAESYLPTGERTPGLSMYAGHPYLAYTLRPGTARGKPDGEWYQSVNADGMRGKRLAVPKPPNTYRVLCVGGSTTYGTGARRDERSYPAVLEELLASRTPAGVTIEVGNAGVPGYTTTETLINLALRLDRFDPDLVIVYHGANDALMIRTPEFERDYSHGRRHFELPEATPLERRLVHSSRILARLIRPEGAWDEYGTLHDFVFTDRFETRTVPMTAQERAEGIAIFGRNLRSIAALLKSRDVDLLLQTFAMDPTKAEADKYRELIRMTNLETQRVAQEQGLPCVDVAKVLDGQSPLFDDWMHFNDQGSRRHAQVLAGPTFQLAAARMRPSGPGADGPEDSAAPPAGRREGEGG